MYIPEIPQPALDYFVHSPIGQSILWGLAGLQIAWTTVGWWILLALPLLPLATVAILKTGVLGLRSVLQSRQSRQQTPCLHCETTNEQAALHCRQCRRELPEPVHVDALGLTTNWPVTDRDAHRMVLLIAGRCPECATALPRSEPQQRCSGCGTTVFSSAAWRDHYLSRIRGEFHSTVGICLAMSSIPFLGLIPWALYDELSLPAKLRRYASDRVGFGERWRLRIVVAAMLAIQWIPFLGAAALPVICIVQCAVYGRALADAPLSESAPEATTAAGQGLQTAAAG
jgi:hypothetical protein